jgi:hypothetical protein
LARLHVLWAGAAHFGSQFPVCNPPLLCPLSIAAVPHRRLIALQRGSPLAALFDVPEAAQPFFDLGLFFLAVRCRLLPGLGRAG